MRRRRFHSLFSNWHKGLLIELTAFSAFLLCAVAVTALVVLLLR